MQASPRIDKEQGRTLRRIRTAVQDAYEKHSECRTTTVIVLTIVLPRCRTPIQELVMRHVNDQAHPVCSTHDFVSTQMAKSRV